MVLFLSLACQPDIKTLPLESQEEEATEGIQRGQFPGEYLMAMFACDGFICMDPTAFNHEIWIMYSDNGEDWAVPDDYEPFEGSVPDLIRRDNTLYVFGGRRTIRRYHFDTDEWEDPVEMSQTGDEIRWNDFLPSSEMMG